GPQQRLMPLENVEDHLLEAGAAGDWSDINLSTTPPKPTIRGKGDQAGPILPDVAQLSIGDTPSPGAATLTLNGKRRTVSQSSDGGSSTGGGLSSDECDVGAADARGGHSKPECFLLIDEQEMLQVKTSEEFIA